MAKSPQGQQLPAVTSPAPGAGRELTAAPRLCRVRANPVWLPGGPCSAHTHPGTLTGTEHGAGPGGCGARGAAAPPRSRAFWKEEPAASAGRGGSRFPHASASAPGPAGLCSRTDTSPPPRHRSGHRLRREQQRRGTNGPQRCPCLSFLCSAHRRLAPRRSGGEVAAGTLPAPHRPEPRSPRRPRANRSRTEPGTCSPPPPPRLCPDTALPVTRGQRQVRSRLLQHRGHAATSPQGSRSGEATARPPWHPGPVTLSRAPLSLRPPGARRVPAVGPAGDPGRRHRVPGAGARERQRLKIGSGGVTDGPLCHRHRGWAGLGWPDTPGVPWGLSEEEEEDRDREAGPGGCRPRGQTGLGTHGRDPRADRSPGPAPGGTWLRRSSEGPGTERRGPNGPRSHQRGKQPPPARRGEPGPAPPQPDPGRPRA